MAEGSRQKELCSLSSEPSLPPSAIRLQPAIRMHKIFHHIEKNLAIAQKLYRTFFYICCILILVSAVIKIGHVLDKKVGIGELKIRLDHLLHALAYFIFSLYYIAGQNLGLQLFKRHKYLLFFVILFLLGFLAEILQIWVPYRSFSLLDMLSNLVGIAAGIIVTVFYLLICNPSA